MFSISLLPLLFLLPLSSLSFSRPSPPSESISAEGSLPLAKCRFAVHKDGPHGELVTGVALDMQLYYSIDCEPEEGFCLSVTNCTVSSEDNRALPYPIIDENGCTLEPSLYNHVTYESSFSAGIVNPLPIRFRGTSSAVLLYCVTALRPTMENGDCERQECPQYEIL